MSGVEVVAAVSAVISAFHGASELLKHIKDKRRKTRQALKEFEERQLQTSLESGEKQIGLRYAQDLKEFGDYMRVGDVDAHQRLQYITIEIQRQVIENLRMAAQHDNAIINLTLLHEASITNRRDVIVTLDQLKQRLDMRRIPRRIEASFNPQSSRGVIGADARTPSISTAYMAAVTIPSETDNGRPRHSFTNFFARKRHDSASSSSLTSPNLDINVSLALEQLARTRGTEDRALIMQDIDHIIDSYQGLHIDRNSHASRESSRWSTSFSPPQPDEGYLWPVPIAGQDQRRVSQDPQTATIQDPNPDFQSHPVFDSVMLNPQQAYSQLPIVARNPFPHMQTHDTCSRLSTTSASSAYCSDTSSLNRNSSTSSQDSQAQSPLPLQVPSRRPISITPHQSHAIHHTQQFQDDGVSPSPRCAEMDASSRQPPMSTQHVHPAYSMNNIHNTSTQLQYSPHGRSVDIESLQYSPYAAVPIIVHDSLPHSEAATHRSSLREQENAEATLNQPKYNVIQNLSPEAPGSRNTQEARSVSHSIISATTLGTAPATAGLRHASIAPSVASTDSSGSTPIVMLPGTRNNLIRQSTVQSGGSERMMDGRACKANNYWGFCKGSWTIREQGKKGLKLRNLPCGMYNTKEVWDCAECTFQGATFSAPHPTKKNKTQAVVDPRAHTSQAGIRFRWIFLAKSHVKKPSQDNRIEGSNYGCTLCCVQGNVSSIYGGIETLMNHIALCHAVDLDERTRKKVNCIIGRVARDDEDWDLNIPVFMAGT